MEKQLEKLCYVRRGKDSTARQIFIIVKKQTMENVEAADLLIRTMYPTAARSSFGTYVIQL